LITDDWNATHLEDSKLTPAVSFAAVAERIGGIVIDQVQPSTSM
jgi:hypothetical protein